MQAHAPCDPSSRDCGHRRLGTLLMISVALIGPDGAGKSTITERLEREPLPAPVKRIYMGVNLQAGGLMLPTTRLALAIKTARGRRPDMVAPFAAPPPSTGGAARAGGQGPRPARPAVPVAGRGVVPAAGGPIPSAPRRDRGVRPALLRRLLPP